MQRSGVPEAAIRREDARLQRVTFAVMTVFSSGFSMYAMGALLGLLLGPLIDQIFVDRLTQA